MIPSVRHAHGVVSRAGLAVRVAVLCGGLGVAGAAAVAADPPVELTFAPSRIVANGLNAVGTAVADFDGDGDLDVAVINGGSTTVQIRRFDPDTAAGTPYPADLFDVPAAVNGIDTADFNKDGRPDLVLSTTSGLYVAFNRGVQAPSGAVRFDVSALYRHVLALEFQGVRVGDVNADGFVDFVAYGIQPALAETVQGVVLGFRNESGSTPAFTPMSLATGQPRVADLAVGDVTGDVYPDYVLASAVSDEIVVLPITAATFSPGTPRSHVVFQEPTGVALADLTGDGHAEVVVAGHFHDTGFERLAVDVLLSVPAGAARDLQHAGSETYAQTAAASPATLSEDVAVGDFDGDDVPDLVVTESLNSRISLLRLTPRLGALSAIEGFDRLQTTISVVDPPAYLAAADVDQDGRTDVVVAHRFMDVGPAVVELLLSTTDIGSALPAPDAARSVTVSSKKVAGGAFQAGRAFTITAIQTLVEDGLRIRVQTTTTPANEGSWLDIPAGASGDLPAYMKPGKKPSKPWTLKTSRVQKGARWFRTVTEVPGREPGVNVTASVVGSDDGYVGPFEVLGAGELLVSSCTAAALSDPTGRTTHRGDRITYTIKLENQGDVAAIGATVRAQPPHRSSIDSVVGDHTITGVSIAWAPFDLPAGATVYRLFSVRVDDDARVDVVFQNLDFQTRKSNAIRSAPCKTRIGSPIYATVTTNTTVVTPGETISYLVRARNSASFTLRSAFVTDTLPDDTGFEDAYFLDGSGVRTGAPVANPLGGANPAVDPVTRVVTWYLGDVGPASSRDVGLDVRVRYDRASVGRIRNGAYGLFGCSPTAGCDPRDLRTFDQTSGEATDVFTDLSGLPAPSVPVLRFDQSAAPDRAGRLRDPTFGDVGTVLPGGEVEYEFFLKNTGTTAARGIRLSGNLPNGVGLVPGSVKAEGAPHAFTLSTGGTLDLFLGDLSPGGSRRITYRAAVRSDARLRSFLLSTAFNVRCESLSGVLHATPIELRTQVVTPVSFDIETHKSRSNFDFIVNVAGIPLEADRLAAIEAGKVVTFLSPWRNNGDESGSNVVITQTLPYGTHVHPNETDGVSFSTDFAGTTVEHVQGKKGKPDTVVFRIPHAPGRAEGFVRVTVRMDAQPARGDNAVSALATITGQGPPSAKDAADSVVMKCESLVSVPVEGTTNTRIFVGKSARLTSLRGEEIRYVIFWGNLCDVAATKVKVTMDVPRGTEYVRAAGGPKAKNGVITLDVGTLAPHAAGSQVLTFRIPLGFKEDRIVEDSCLIESGNALSKVAPPLSTYVLPPEKDRRVYVWEGFSVYFEVMRMTFSGVDQASIDEYVTKLDRMSFATNVGGADVVPLENGAFLVPLGGGQVLACGGEAMTVGADAAFRVTAEGFTVAGGNATAIQMNLLPGYVGSVSAASIFANPGILLAQRAGSIVASGGGNLIGMDGGSLIANDGGTFTSLQDLVAQGGGNFVDARGGEIVASGGGNIVSSGGGNLVAQGGGNLVAQGGGNLVAQGGGNVLAVSNGLVAQGGGNFR